MMDCAASVNQFTIWDRVGDLLRKMVGVVLSGVGESLRYFNKVNEAVISPKKVLYRNSWYAAAASVAVEIVTPVVNGYLTANVVFATTSANNPTAPTSVTWNGHTLTLLASNSIDRCYVLTYGLADPGSGSGNLVVSGQTNVTYTYTQVILWSGVDQANPMVSKTDADGTGTLTTAVTSEDYGVVIESGVSSDDSPSGHTLGTPGAGQTALSAASYLYATGASTSVSRNVGTTYGWGCMLGVALRAV